MTIAQSLKKIFNADNEIKIIGTRHGEKLYETLLTREEMQNSEDMGKYFRIPADNRSLNYDQYFTKGQLNIAENDDYNSHNTERLELQDTIELLSKLDFIQKELNSHE